MIFALIAIACEIVGDRIQGSRGHAIVSQLELRRYESHAAGIRDRSGWLRRATLALDF
jgi:hypothetical protein